MAVIKNLKKGAARLKKAVAKKERIILYGDSDLDGTTSVIIMEQAIKSIGGEITAIHFPDREKEGYGITTHSLNELKKYAPALLITVDLGISNIQEVLDAKKLGFEVMIIDHHKVLEKVPEADIVIDPKQPGDKYPFKEFAACGLTFRVAEALFDGKLPNALRKTLIELAALGTIADMMKREEDNLQIIHEGLEALEDSWNPGIRAFLETEPYASYENIQVKVQQMISVLNVRDVKDGFPASFRLLTCPSFEKAKEMLKEFAEQNRERKERIRDLADEVRERISLQKPGPIVFEGGGGFEFMHLGAVASIIEREEKKPTFIFKREEKESLGSVRAPEGKDTVQAMQYCAKLLKTYGGHPQASGFRIKTENLDKFHTCLEEYFAKHD